MIRVTFTRGLSCTLYIGQYLLATRDKGMVLRPNRKDMSLNMYCDADFSGLYLKSKTVKTQGVRAHALAF